MRAAKGRVLVVEDESLIAMLVEDMLDLMGYEVSDSAATLEDGILAAARGDFDVAMLDVNLRGKMSFPIADLLTERQIPFVFVSGYSTKGIEPRFVGSPALQKPYPIEALEQILERLTARSG